MHAPRDFDEWRSLARASLGAGRTPDAVDWSDARQSGLALAMDSAAEAEDSGAGSAVARVPRDLVALLQAVAQHRDPHRWDLMYRLLWRAAREGRGLLHDAGDAQVRRARLMEREVRRDLHKMHAYVRFREAEDGAPGDPPRYVAWFEPDHHILHEGARFFVRRFGSMHWTLVTPEGAAVWDQQRLVFVDAPPRDTLPRRDGHEALWRAYYRSICNVARLRPAAMQREMPQRYWKNLPEASEIGALLREAPRLAATLDAPRPMAKRHAPIRSAGPARSPAVDADAALQACRRCPLWEHATQAVAGEGSREARLVLVGEQPGDEEDLRGRPFVGPAGRLLDELLREAGLERGQLYVTNAVKHFKWEPRGKRRLHKTPAQREIEACRPWLVAELGGLRPKVIVALGATALQALAGRALPVGRAREMSLEAAPGVRVVATWHPSALLRAEADRAAGLRRDLLDDLRLAARLTAGEGG